MGLAARPVELMVPLQRGVLVGPRKITGPGVAGVKVALGLLVHTTPLLLTNTGSVRMNWTMALASEVPALVEPSKAWA